MKKILIVSVILCLAVSCQKGDEPLFGVQAFLTADKGTLYGDFGECYVPSSNPGVDLNTGRYYVNGYATEDWGNQKYKLLIVSIAPVTMNEVLVKSGIEDPGLVGYDAIKPVIGYSGGNYLNLRIEYLFRDETVKHTYNLVFDDAKSNKDTLYFDLRHQANKDTLATKYMAEMKAMYTYDSFDISRFRQKDKNKMVLALRYNWYKTGSAGYLPETEDLKLFMDYTY